MDPKEDEKDMTVGGHLEEFRFRLIICLVAIAAASVVAYAYIDEIIALLSAPAGKLYFLNPAEVFFAYIEIAVFTGVVVTLPVWLYELWLFIAPALHPRERRAIWWLLPSAIILFYFMQD